MDEAARNLEPQELLAHAGWVRSLARRLLADEARAEDVAQQALVSALEGGPRRPGALGGWLAAVVRRKSWNERTAQARRARRERLAAAPEAQPSAADVIARGEALQRVVDAVMALPEPYRSVVLLRYFEELPPRRIARQLRSSDDAVRTQLRRGLEMLRKRLASDHGPDWRESCRLLAAPAGLGGLANMLPQVGESIVGAKLTLAVSAAALAVGAVFLWPEPAPEETAARQQEALAPAAAMAPAAAIPEAAAQEAASPLDAARRRAPARRSGDAAQVGELLEDVAAEPQAVFTGRVLYSDGRPVPQGTEVRLTAWDEVDSGLELESVDADAGSGSFWISVHRANCFRPDGSPFTEWSLLARTPDGVEGRLDFVHRDFESEWSDGSVLLEPVPYFSGRVLRGGSQEPHPGAFVEFWTRPDAASAPQRLEAYTRDDGGFHMALRPGHTPAALVVSAEDCARLVLAPERVAALEPGDFLLLALSAGATLEGLVLGPDGTPTGEGTPVEWRAGPRQDEVLLHANSRRASTGPDGRFRMDQVSAGPGTVAVLREVQAAGEGARLLSRAAGAGASQELFLADGGHQFVTLTLPPPQSIAGRLPAGATDPEDWLVALVDAHGREQASAPVAADGSFEIAAPAGASGTLFARRAPQQRWSTGVVLSFGDSFRQAYLETEDSLLVSEEPLQAAAISADGAEVAWGGALRARTVAVPDGAATLSLGLEAAVGEAGAWGAGDPPLQAQVFSGLFVQASTPASEPFPPAPEWDWRQDESQERAERDFAWSDAVTSPAPDVQLESPSNSVVVSLRGLRRDGRPLRALLLPEGSGPQWDALRRESLEFRSGALAREWRLRGLPAGAYVLRIYDRHGLLSEETVRVPAAGPLLLDVDALAGAPR
ncbi:MAG: RNA polymerase sigma factor [Planctomycetota bacterium]|nr:MAG: RNA polymerase sigma factor [Planctomycetota bacterium]